MIDLKLINNKRLNVYSPSDKSLIKIEVFEYDDYKITDLSTIKCNGEACEGCVYENKKGYNYCMGAFDMEQDSGGFDPEFLQLKELDEGIPCLIYGIYEVEFSYDPWNGEWDVESWFNPLETKTRQYPDGRW